VSNTITIPEGCFLRGDWRDPNSGTGSYGTVISAAVGAGFGCLFQTQPNTDMGGIVGLTVYYPDQNASSPIDTGWVITQRGGGNKTFRNITFINAYKGIHLGNDGTGVGTVCVDLSHVYGTVLSQGLCIYYAPGAGGAYHVTFNNSYWANAGKAYNAPSESLLNKWTKIECPLGRWFAGKTIRAIGVAHDDGESTGMFKAVFDDLFIGVPPDGKPH
jgi:hypothetical protein